VQLTGGGAPEEYRGAASSPPVRIALASLTVILFTASSGSFDASGTAASAARFMVSTSSSAYFPMPIARISPSARRSDSGSGIFTCGLPKKPSRRAGPQGVSRSARQGATRTRLTAVPRGPASFMLR